MCLRQNWHPETCSALQVARRVKVLQPDTPVLNVRRLKGTGAQDKIASGIEVAYSITYTPENTDHFYHDLVVCTEREKFLVPCTAAGSKAALDFPDHLEFPLTPAKCSSSQTCLVTNVGSIAADFTLTAYPPFHAEPARAQLPPGDTMQCSIQYNPQSTGTPQQSGRMLAELACLAQVSPKSCMLTEFVVNCWQASTLATLRSSMSKGTWSTQA